jgi:hypothetical protein
MPREKLDPAELKKRRQKSAASKKERIAKRKQELKTLVDANDTNGIVDFITDEIELLTTRAGCGKPVNWTVRENVKCGFRKVLKTYGQKESGLLQIPLQ